MGYESPPFYSLIVEEDCVYFESPWSPPYQDLMEIAERFDVSFKLQFRISGQPGLQNFSHTCVRDEKLGRDAHLLREQILSTNSYDHLIKLEEQVHQHHYSAKIDAHERQMLMLLIGKRFSESQSPDDPSPDQQNRPRRGR